MMVCGILREMGGGGSGFLLLVTLGTLELIKANSKPLNDSGVIALTVSVKPRNSTVFDVLFLGMGNSMATDSTTSKILHRESFHCTNNKLRIQQAILSHTVASLLHTYYTLHTYCLHLHEAWPWQQVTPIARATHTA